MDESLDSRKSISIEGISVDSRCHDTDGECDQTPPPIHALQRRDPLESVGRIDVICQAFEAAWSETTPPVLEDFLSQAEHSLQTRLLRKLLAVELEVLQKRGIKTDHQAYRHRFVEYADIVSGVFLNARGGDASGMTLGNYELLAKIGAGGMGTVYQARHTSLGTTVAVKLLQATLLQDDQALARFQREMLAIGKLNDEHIIAATDAGMIYNIPYLVMEYVEGRDLGSVAAERGPLPVELTLDYVSQAARGLDSAHAKGVIHRDIKPANLLVGNDGKIRILDWGLARFLRTPFSEGPGSLTESGTVLGTADYMAPEQSQEHQRVDQRSDIYSLGCTLYRLLAGRVLYPKGSTVDRIIAHRTARIPSLLLDRPDVPVRLDELMQRMVAKSPDKRPQSMAEVIDCLRAVRENERQPDGIPQSRSVQSTRPLRSGRFVWQLATVVVLSLGLFSVLLVAFPAIRSTLPGAISSTVFWTGEPASGEASKVWQSSEFAGPDSGFNPNRSPVKIGSIPVTLKAPFDNLSTFFDAGRVGNQQDGLFLKPNSPGRSSRSVRSKVPCDGNFKLVAIFSESWLRATELGVKLRRNSTDVYEFLFRPAVLPVNQLGEVPRSGRSFAVAQQAGGCFECVILRNDVAIQSQLIRADVVPTTEIKICVQRIEDKLSLQINSHGPCEILDPFAIDGTIADCELIWGDDVRLRELTVQADPQPYRGSEFLTPDRLYHAGQFEAALSAYQQIASPSQDSTIKQESVYKQGLCLIGLNRREDALTTWDTLVKERKNGWDRWSLLAMAQHWLVKLEQDVGTSDPTLPPEFSQEADLRRLVRVCPLAVRQKLRDGYIDQDQFAKFVFYKAGRRKRLELLERIDPLLSSDAVPTASALLALVKGWEYHRDLSYPSKDDQRDSLKKARDAAIRLHHFYPESPQALFLLERLLRLSKQQQQPAGKQSLELIARLVDGQSERPPAERLEGVIHLARVYAATDDFDRAQQMLHQAENIIESLETSGQRPHVYQVGLTFLLKGFLLEKLESPQAAMEAWKQGTNTVRIRLAGQDDDPTGMVALVFFSLAGLSGDLRQLDVDKYFHPSKFINSESVLLDLPLQKALVRDQFLVRSFLSTAARHRGRQLCQDLAFDRLVGSDYLRWPVELATDFMIREAFFGQVSEEQEHEVWQLCDDIVNDIAFRGKLIPAILNQAAVNWTADFQFSPGLLQLLPALPRANYVIANYLANPHAAPRKPGANGEIPADLVRAESIFHQVILDSRKQSACEGLEQLAKDDLELLKANQGRLLIINQMPSSMVVKISQGDQVVAELRVEKRETLNLPIGSYELSLHDSRPDAIVESDVRVFRCSRATVQIRRK